jgi:preprotein translocase subunit YajC
MFIDNAYAQTAPGGFASGLPASLSSLVQFAPLIAIAFVFYFLVLRPQQVQQKTLKEKLGALKRGDKIVTAGGIIGTVKKTVEGATEIDVEIAPNVTVSVVRSTVTTVLAPQAAANDKT